MKSVIHRASGVTKFTASSWLILGVLATATEAARASAPSPILHYSFDSGTYAVGQGTVDDVAAGDVGNNQIQEIGSGVTMGVKGISGTSAYFDGGFASGGGGGSDNVFLKTPSAQMRGPGRDNLYGMPAVTLTAWVLPTEQGFRSSWGGSRTIARADNSVFANPLYLLQFADLNTSPTTLSFTFTVEGAPFETTVNCPLPGPGEEVLFDGNWHMVAGVYDGHQARIYWDGQPLGDPIARTGNIAPLADHAFEVGNFPFAEDWDPFRGAIDEVKLYSVGLTATQILDDYNALIHPVQPEPASLQIALYAGLEITGTPGATYCIEYATGVPSTNWATLTNLVLPSSPYLFFDSQSVADPTRRFYRAVSIE